MNEKLIKKIAEKKGISEEEAKEFVKLLLEKAKKIKEDLHNYTTIEAVVLGYTINDKYSNLIKEIDREIEAKGIEQVLHSGKIKIVDDKILHIDYRRFINDRENKNYGKIIEEMSDEERYNTILYLIAKFDNYEFVQGIVRGKQEFDINHLYDITGFGVSEGRFIVVDYLKKDKFVYSKVLDNLRKSKNYTTISTLEDKYKTLIEQNKTPFVFFEGLIVSKDENIFSESKWYIVSDLFGNEIAVSSEQDFEEGDEVFVGGNVYERGREENKSLAVKSYLFIRTEMKIEKEQEIKNTKQIENEIMEDKLKEIDELLF